MGIARQLATTLFVIAVPLLLITSNVRVLTSEVRFYERGLREHGAAERTGISLEELDRASAAIVRYFENDAPRLAIIVEVDGREVSLFNERETEHMEDVKSVVRVLYRVNEFSIAYVLAFVGFAVLWAGEFGPRRLARDTLLGLGVGFIVVAVIGAFALTGFDSAWDQFHRILFRNDLWQLNPDTDRLIQMFPEPFWEEATFVLGAMITLQAGVVAGACGAYLVVSRRAGASPGEVS